MSLRVSSVALQAKLGCHPRLVRFYGKSMTADGRSCVVTEWARLGSLDRVLEQHYDMDADQSLLSGAVATAICAQVLCGWR